MVDFHLVEGNGKGNGKNVTCLWVLGGLRGDGDGRREARGENLNRETSDVYAPVLKM